MLLVLPDDLCPCPGSTAEVRMQIKSLKKLLKADLNVNRVFAYLQIAWTYIRRNGAAVPHNVSNSEKLALGTSLLPLPVRQTWQLAMDHVAFCSP